MYVWVSAHDVDPVLILLVGRPSKTHKVGRILRVTFSMLFVYCVNLFHGEYWR